MYQGVYCLHTLHSRAQHPDPADGKPGAGTLVESLIGYSSILSGQLEPAGATEDSVSGSHVPMLICSLLYLLF